MRKLSEEKLYLILQITFIVLSIACIIIALKALEILVIAIWFFAWSIICAMISGMCLAYYKIEKDFRKITKRMKENLKEATQFIREHNGVLSKEELNYLRDKYNVEQISVSDEENSDEQNRI